MSKKMKIWHVWLSVWANSWKHFFTTDSIWLQSQRSTRKTKRDRRADDTSWGSSSCLILTCLAVCAGNTASSPCTRPPSPPSQVWCCVPAESSFSKQDDYPYSEDDTLANKRFEFDFTLTTALVCVSFRFYLVNATTSSRRNSSTGKVKPGMWIIGHLSVDGPEEFTFLLFLSPLRCICFPRPTYQNTWKTSPRWAWRSSGWPWGRLGRSADLSRWWAKRQTAGFSRGSRPAPGGSRWTTIWRASNNNNKEEHKQLVRL